MKKLLAAIAASLIGFATRFLDDSRRGTIRLVLKEGGLVELNASATVRESVPNSYALLDAYRTFAFSARELGAFEEMRTGLESYKTVSARIFLRADAARIERLSRRSR